MPKTSWMGKIPSNALSIACAGLFFLFVSALHAEEIQSDLILSQHLDIRVDTGRVFMDVRDVEITEVLKALARKANFDVVVTEGIAGSVTIRINGETLEKTTDIHYYIGGKVGGLAGGVLTVISAAVGGILIANSFN